MHGFLDSQLEACGSRVENFQLNNALNRERERRFSELLWCTRMWECLWEERCLRIRVAKCCFEALLYFCRQQQVVSSPIPILPFILKVSLFWEVWWRKYGYWRQINALFIHLYLLATLIGSCIASYSMADNDRAALETETIPNFVLRIPKIAGFLL